jgi:hypothetical protein
MEKPIIEAVDLIAKYQGRSFANTVNRLLKKSLGIEPTKATSTMNSEK